MKLIYLPVFVGLLITAVCPPAMGANEGNADSQKDPFVRTVYPKAFRQVEIWKKYPLILEMENLTHLLKDQNQTIIEQYAPEELEPRGCFSCITSLFDCFYKRPHNYQALAQNENASHEDLAPDLNDDHAYIQMSDENAPLPLSPPRPPSDEEFVKMYEDFSKELVSDFLNKRKTDAYRPIKDEIYSTASYCAITGALLGLGSATLPAATIGMGTGFGAFVIANQVATAVYTTIKDTTRLRNFSSDPLLPYELRYALLKRFIDPKLWETTEAKFALARTNPYSQQEAISFFDVLFKLPRSSKSFLLSPLIIPGQAEPTFDKKLKFTYDKLVHTVDRLFEPYQESSSIRLELKTTLWQHILASIDRYHTKRNLFIVGPPGVGKTHLIIELGKEIGIQVVPLNLSLVNTPADLFGTKERPGLLLEALMTAKYKNHIMTPDEASETFNNPEFSSALKILFETELGQFESPYLKSTAIDIQPWLLLSLGNTPFSDKAPSSSARSQGPTPSEKEELPPNALANRFVQVQMPHFKESFIRERADVTIPKMLMNFPYVKTLQDLRDFNYTQELGELETLIKNSGTIRDLEKSLPSWCTKVNEKRRLEIESRNDRNLL